MKKVKTSQSYNSNVQYVHHELNLENLNGTSYFIITEIINNKPSRSFYYRIPETYKDDSLLGAMDERFCAYCPN